MKILFAGTPAFAICPLQKLVERGYVGAVLTQPDKKQGRRAVLTAPPVKIAAESSHLPVLQFEDPNEHLKELKSFGCELMITCAYGKILREELLSLFPLGVYNIHASLLPRYRGAAPIQRAIIDGEEESGITIMKTELSLDTGDMLMSRKIKIEKSDTFGTLSEKLSLLSGEMIVEAVEKIASGKYSLQKQGEGFTCKKVTKTFVDFSKSAKEVSALIRGLSPAPLSFGTLRGEVINFYMAEETEDISCAPAGEIIAASPKEGLIVKCGQGAVKITLLQAAGGKVLSSRDFLNGRKNLKGQKFDKSLL